MVECLVRPLFVIELLEVAQTFELFPHAARRGTGNLLQQGQVHTFMTAILLRLAGGDAFRRNAGLDQLHG
jgi:hypothetical protein